jgi:hypothetical protein
MRGFRCGLGERDGFLLEVGEEGCDVGNNNSLVEEKGMEEFRIDGDDGSAEWEVLVIVGATRDGLLAVDSGERR